MNAPRWTSALAAVAGLALASAVLAACSSSPSNFDQNAALRGVDTILAAFKPDSSGQGPTLLSCPFGSMSTIGTELANAAGAPLGKLGKATEEITPWGNDTDGGRAINCAVVSSVFGFDVGVQRGKRDEHPAAGSGWTGPSKLGGGDLYYSTSASSKVCSVAWARPGTFFTVGVQIGKVALSGAQCKAVGSKGVTIVVKALEKTEPFNVVPSSSSGAPFESTGAPNPTTSPATSAASK